jgi:hypothetical protein
LVLGGVIDVGGHSSRTKLKLDGLNPEDATTWTADVVLGPKLDYMFSEGSRVRQFVGVAVGMMYSSFEENGVNPNDETSASLYGVRFQGGAGLRWFAAPGLSLDPSLRFAWSTAFGESKVEEPEAGEAESDLTTSGTSILLNFSVSGWL